MTIRVELQAVPPQPFAVDKLPNAEMNQ